MFYITGWFVLPLFHLFAENSETFIKILSIITDEKQDKMIKNVTNIVVQFTQTTTVIATQMFQIRTEANTLVGQNTSLISMEIVLSIV